MTIKEYQLEASRTCSDLGNYQLNYLHMKMGVITEIGEVIDIFKKNLAYKKEIDTINLGEELADISWYICNQLTFNGLLAEIKEMSPQSSNEDIIDSLDCVYSGWTQYTDNTIDFDYFEQLGILKSIAEYFKLDYFNLLDKNIAKLKARFPEKFTEEAALNRNLEKERQILEGNAS